MTGPDSRSESERLEPLLSIEEVTGVLRISESGVYRLVRSGDLLRVKVGNRTLFEPSEVRRFIEARRQAPGAELDPRLMEADHA